MKNLKDFNREELVELKKRAEKQAYMIEGTNPIRVRAYEKLIDACDHLDAMMNRCVIDAEKTIEK